jgi:hypothetical protein
MVNRVTAAARKSGGLVALIALAACSDLTDPSDRPVVQRARLTVTGGGSTATYTVTAAGGNSPTPVELVPGSNQVTVNWLDASGNAVPTNGYGLVITRLSAGVAFSSSGLNSGTLQVSGGPRAAFGELRLRDASNGDDAFAADLDMEVR